MTGHVIGGDPSPCRLDVDEVVGCLPGMPVSGVGLTRWGWWEVGDGNGAPSQFVCVL
jgi:hypothetical protein